MRKRILYELFYFLMFFAALALVLHPDLLDAPLQRFSTMQTLGNYFHPLLYSAGLYVIVAILRLIILLLIRFFKRSH